MSAPAQHPVKHHQLQRGNHLLPLTFSAQQSLRAEPNLQPTKRQLTLKNQ